jgi:hypothetical protein
MNRLLSEKSRIPLALILVLILFSAGSIFAGKGPKIKFKEESKDFGKMKQGKVLTHIFVFENEGDETLKINRVKTSCGCTAALLSNKEIAPGGKGEIKLTYNTRGFQGKNTKYIDVESNDPAQPRKRLAVSVEIEVPPRPKIFLDRYAIDLGLILENEVIQAKCLFFLKRSKNHFSPQDSCRERGRRRDKNTSQQQKRSDEGICCDKIQ